MTLCECGCGRPTPLAKKTRNGLIKDQPTRFIKGHYHRFAEPPPPIEPPNPSGLCQCGCGQAAPVATKTHRRNGHLRGHPMRFIAGHGGRLTHGMWGTPTYHSWAGMIKRCTNPSQRQWMDYGGRENTVCPRWRDSFAAFLADMGVKPEGTSIDRIDPDGNYEPDNCRWATWKEQRANRRVHA